MSDSQLPLNLYLITTVEAVVRETTLENNKFLLFWSDESLFVCSLVVCPIMTLNPLAHLPQILMEEPERTTGIFLAWNKNSKLSGLNFVSS